MAVRRIRAKGELSLREIGDLFDVSRQAIHKIVTGKSHKRAEFLVRIRRDRS